MGHNTDTDDRAVHRRTGTGHGRGAAGRRVPRAGSRLLGTVGLAAALVGAGAGAAHAAGTTAAPSPAPRPASVAGPAAAPPSVPASAGDAAAGATTVPSPRAEAPLPTARDAAPVPTEVAVPPTCDRAGAGASPAEQAAARQRCADAALDGDSALPVGGIDTGAGGTASTSTGTATAPATLAAGRAGATDAADAAGQTGLALAAGGTGLGALAAVGATLTGLGLRRRRAGAAD
ncbi:hypothetical protein ACG83_02995 [Frankia sp. R43]|uniref:hypothetical protein n=1 Tax=Frankia sp. R43 TaxID=269536 RepID=UPI0006CA5A35|nr:hypothetical protein [Frankia sp. R43]KPM56833.1 hypothetical protein ACG83_02995 [Frankia sp. R43]